MGRKSAQIESVVFISENLYDVLGRPAIKYLTRPSGRESVATTDNLVKDCDGWWVNRQLECFFSRPISWTQQLINCSDDVGVRQNDEQRHHKTNVLDELRCVQQPIRWKFKDTLRGPLQRHAQK